MVERVIPEEWLHGAVGVLVRAVEGVGALVIALGALVGLLGFATALLQRRGSRAFVGVRLRMGRFLALGLEFQLAADLLATAVAPSWTQIGKLAAVAAIRTALNYFLEREIRVGLAESAEPPTARREG